MSNEDFTAKSSFLYSAINDAQELIRFTDTKTGIAITVLGAYIVVFFASFDAMLKYYSEFSFSFWFFFIFFLVLLFLCIVVTSKIIRPTNNPVENLNMGKTAPPKLKFFLAKMNFNKSVLYPFSNSSEFKLDESYEDYKNVLDSSSQQVIIDTLIVELMKVSYIRNIKNSRFNTLLWLLSSTTILFFVSYIMLKVQTQNLIELHEKIRHCYCGVGK